MAQGETLQKNKHEINMTEGPDPEKNAVIFLSL